MAAGRVRGLCTLAGQHCLFVCLFVVAVVVGCWLLVCWLLVVGCGCWLWLLVVVCLFVCLLVVGCWLLVVVVVDGGDGGVVVVCSVLFVCLLL